MQNVCIIKTLSKVTIYISVLSDKFFLFFKYYTNIKISTFNANLCIRGRKKEKKNCDISNFLQFINFLLQQIRINVDERLR